MKRKHEKRCHLSRTKMVDREWWNKISWTRLRCSNEERGFHSRQRKTGRASFVLHCCGSACCFPAKGRCLQERIRGPEVVGSTAPPITARPSLSTLPHVTTRTHAHFQVFRLSSVHTRLGKPK